MTEHRAILTILGLAGAFLLGVYGGRIGLRGWPCF